MPARYLHLIVIALILYVIYVHVIRKVPVKKGG